MARTVLQLKNWRKGSDLMVQNPVGGTPIEYNTVVTYVQILQMRGNGICQWLGLSAI
jgi:hypothetical protein